MTKLGPEALYSQLGHLIASAPNLSDIDSQEVMLWLGRAYALVGASGDKDGAQRIKRLHDLLRAGFTPGPYKRDHEAVMLNVMQLMDILYRALAVAELDTPAPAQGAFIPAGNAFEAMVAVGKVLQTVATDVLIVDPYMDEKALTDFAALAPSAVSIRLLADQAGHKATLRSAATRWTSQYGSARPLETRLAASRTLHDRLIAIDGSGVWTLTQSLNAFAARSPASIVRVDAETAALKIAAYEAIWQAAAPI